MCEYFEDSKLKTKARSLWDPMWGAQRVLQCVAVCCSVLQCEGFCEPIYNHIHSNGAQRVSR